MDNHGVISIQDANLFEDYTVDEKIKKDKKKEDKKEEKKEEKKDEKKDTKMETEPPVSETNPLTPPPTEVKPEEDEFEIKQKKKTRHTVINYDL